MPRCDGCGSKRCECVLVDGDNTEVLGTGSVADPYRVNVDVDGAGGSRLVGEIISYGGGVAPAGWLLCDGAAVSRTTYSNLFIVLGETYGDGDGSTTFNLPDLAGRVPFGTNGPHPRGTIGGQESITLVTDNLPSHRHTIAHTHAMGHTHGMAHVHDMTHGHTTDSQGQHAHTVKQSNDDGSNNGTFDRGAQGDRDVNTTAAGDHAHNVSAFAGNTGGDNRAGVTDTDNRAGTTGGSSAANSGLVGSGLAHTNMPPYAAVTFLIKT